MVFGSGYGDLIKLQRRRRSWIGRRKGLQVFWGRMDSDALHIVGLCVQFGQFSLLVCTLHVCPVIELRNTPE